MRGLFCAVASALDSLPTFYPRTRTEWRQWLLENHAAAPGIWLIQFRKGSGEPTVTYDEAVEEALCFGWIDSKPGRIDERSHKLLFTPRKPKSVWSKVNKQRLEKLAAANLLMPAGLAAIDRAKANGSWTSLDEVEELVVPADLRAALDANPAAAAHFAAFSRSATKALLQWISAAKRPETRAARIAQTVAEAAHNRKANQWEPRQKASGSST